MVLFASESLFQALANEAIHIGLNMTLETIYSFTPSQQMIPVTNPLLLNDVSLKLLHLPALSIYLPVGLMCLSC